MNVTCPHCSQVVALDDRAAGTVANCPACGQAMTVPSPLPPPVMKPPSARPTSVTVFGVLSIVFGGLALLCTPINLVTANMPNPMFNIPGFRAWTIFSSILGMAAAIWQLSNGIGLLRLKPWARTGSMAYAWFAIVMGVVSMTVMLVLLLPRMGAATGGSSDPAMAAGMIGGVIGGTVGGIIGMIYPILLLVFMRKPRVVEAFQKQG